MCVCHSKPAEQWVVAGSVGCRSLPKCKLALTNVIVGLLSVKRGPCTGPNSGLYIPDPLEQMYMTNEHIHHQTNEQANGSMNEQITLAQHLAA